MAIDQKYMNSTAFDKNIVNNIETSLHIEMLVKKN